MRDWIEAILKAFRPPKRKRLELRFLPYAEADKLLRENSAWTLAKEEDTNRQIGMVYLERLEEYPEFSRNDLES